jgi:hypothetical protein
VVTAIHEGGTGMGENAVAELSVGIIMILLVACLAPSFIAYNRHHKHLEAIIFLKSSPGGRSLAGLALSFGRLPRLGLLESAPISLPRLFESQ